MPHLRPPDTAPHDPDHWVICLCADWCGLCRDYQSVFAQMAARHPECRFAWLDIEDQADLVGDIDVETFPTVLIADKDGTRFFGPLTPHAQTLSRLLDSMERSSLQATPHLPTTQQLLHALRAAPEYWIKA
ncbi:MAG: thioredoxin family protein [Polaromonas sp.]|uniref:thioredoxin family protein n=1 Tax=Polaromonas sp. TaxID=1869339 RepID=UPI00272FFE59|nr:thioredoxin family protein [Polaromonas sp.]MDP2255120.1 thioredoxin family protein [Polaromonas sp.]MDP3708189.1 thioredoxin family protein [Polaromonas sp.]